MRSFLVLLASLSVFSSGAVAAQEQAMAVLKDIKVEGVGLMSTPRDIQAVMDGYGKVSVRCEHMRTPQFLDKRKRLMPHRERWTCTSQATATPGVWKRLTVNYLHNRVVSVEYEGSVMPDLNGSSVVEYVEGLDKRFKSISDLGSAYTYQGFADVPGASSQYLTQNLGLKLQDTCKRYDGVELSYDVGVSFSYNEIPSQNHKGVNIKLFNDESNNCYSIVDMLK